jgi:hypothetical protein
MFTTTEAWESLTVPWFQVPDSVGDHGASPESV